MIRRLVVVTALALGSLGALGASQANACERSFRCVEISFTNPQTGCAGYLHVDFDEPSASHGESACPVAP